MARPACLHRRCDRAATQRVTMPYCRPAWFGCDEHAPVMADALHVGQSAVEVRIERLTRP